MANKGGKWKVVVAAVAAVIIAVAISLLFFAKNGTRGAGAAVKEVDLGLSVNWASVNLGAKSPVDDGDYYSWGELQPKDEYEWSTYKFCEGDYDSITKYCSSSDYGEVDGLLALSAEDDAVVEALGEGWRIPSYAEWTELKNKCDWVWTEVKGVPGYRITSKVKGYTDKSIFLPATGNKESSRLDDHGRYGYYWSSSIVADYPYDAWSIYFRSGYVCWDYYYRFYGFTIRPVKDK